MEKENNNQETDAPASEWTRLVMSYTDYQKEVPVFNSLVKQLCEGAAQARELLAQKLLLEGHTPETVTIAERLNYDDNNHIVSFECWPIFKT